MNYVWGILFFKARAACWHAGGGWDGGGTSGGGRRGGLGRSSGSVQGRSPGGGFGGRAHRLSRNELKMFHEQLCHEIRQIDEQFVHLLVSLPGFRRQQCIADDSVRLCVQFMYD